MALQSPTPFQTFLHNGLRKASSNWHGEERLVAPILSYNAMRSIAKQTSTPISETFPMVGLPGRVVSRAHATDAEFFSSPTVESIDPVFLNVNAPWSMFIFASKDIKLSE